MFPFPKDILEIAHCPISTALFCEPFSTSIVVPFPSALICKRHLTSKPVLFPQRVFSDKILLCTLFYQMCSEKIISSNIVYFQLSSSQLLSSKKTLYLNPPPPFSFRLKSHCLNSTRSISSRLKRHFLKSPYPFLFQQLLSETPLRFKSNYCTFNCPSSEYFLSRPKNTLPQQSVSSHLKRSEN